MGIPATLSSVPATTPYIQYIATLGQTVFPYPFVITQDSDLIVVVNGVTLNTDQGYSLSGQGNPTGGNVTFTLGQAANAIITLYRDITIERITQISQNSGFSSTAFNAEFNNIYLILQQLAESQSFSLQVPNTNSPAPVTTLTPANYALRSLMFDANGNPTPGVLLASTLTQSIFNSFLATATAFVTEQAAITTINQGISDLDSIETVVAALEAGTATNVATFGDSTMWGANPANLAAQVAIPPYLQLQNFVNTFLGNTACTVVNYAISGTTLAQMLAGTDGSGLTFAQRIAAEPAPIVYCNHGVNDAFGPNITTAAVYRANLLTYIQIVRAAGKTPVLVTPHPCLTIGGFGSQARAENTARFANIMRTVAKMHGVTLIDNNKNLAQLIGTDNDSNQVNLNLPLTWIPDGVHVTQAGYEFTGNNLADAILGAQVESFVTADQRIGASRANTAATSQSISATTGSRAGATVTSGTVSPQTLRVLFRIERPGLNISLMHPIFSSGSATIAVTLDGSAIGALASFSQNSAGFNTSNFLQDVETVLARNVPPGFHMLILTTSSTGAACINSLRSRDADKPIVLGSTGVDLGVRQLIEKKFEFVSGTNNVIAMVDYACSRFIDGFEFEWTGQMVKNSGLAIVANTGSTTGAATPQQLMIFGLNGAGFAAVSEATAPGTFTTTALDSTDHSGGSHVYRVIVTAANPGTAQMFVDDVSVGTFSLTQAYFGGWLGMWKNLNTDTLIITDLCRVWRF